MKIFNIFISVWFAIVGTSAYAKDSSWQKFEAWDMGYLHEGDLKKNVAYFEIRSYAGKDKKGKRLFKYRGKMISKFSKKPEILFDKLKPNFGSKADLPEKSNAFFIDNKGKSWKMDMIKDVKSLMTSINTPSEIQLAIWLHGKQEGYRYRKRAKGYDVDIEYQKKGVCGTFKEKVFVTNRAKVTQVSLDHSQKGCKKKKPSISAIKKKSNNKIPKIMTPVQEPTLTNDWKHVSVGGDKIYAIKKSGALWEFRKGRDKHSFKGIQIGGKWHSVCANNYKVMLVKRDGTLWGFGRDLTDLRSGKKTESKLPVKLSGEKDWQGACCSGFTPEGPVDDDVGESQVFCVGLKKDGSLWEWQGHLGDYVSNPSLKPKQIGKAKGWKYVSIGYASIVAMKQNGSKWAIGHNGYDFEPRFPEEKIYKKLTKVKNSTRVGLNRRAMDQPFFFSEGRAEIKKNGTLWIWRQKVEKKFDDGSVMYTDKTYKYQEKTKSRNWKNVSISLSMAAAIKKDGTLWFWVFR